MLDRCWLVDSIRRDLVGERTGRNGNGDYRTGSNRGYGLAISRLSGRLARCDAARGDLLIAFMPCSLALGYTVPVEHWGLA